jgi:hypothetical protein
MESIEQRWQRFVDESIEENNQTEAAEAILNSGIFFLELLNTGAEYVEKAVSVIGVVAEKGGTVAEKGGTVVPFIQIVALALQPERRKESS